MFSNRNELIHAESLCVLSFSYSLGFNESLKHHVNHGQGVCVFAPIVAESFHLTLNVGSAKFFGVFSFENTFNLIRHGGVAKKILRFLAGRYFDCLTFAKVFEALNILADNNDSFLQCLLYLEKFCQLSLGSIVSRPVFLGGIRHEY